MSALPRVPKLVFRATTIQNLICPTSELENELMRISLATNELKILATKGQICGASVVAQQ